MRILLAAALLALAACDSGGDSGVMREIERAEKAEADSAQQFLAEARARPGAQEQPSGLIVEFVRRGADQTLPQPGPTSAVLVHYEGKLADGRVFDSSIQRGEPAQFPLDQVVDGFSEAIQLMRPGDEVIAYLPSELGYKAEGSPPVIPPNADLQFRIQLLAFQAADGSIVQAPR